MFTTYTIKSGDCLSKLSTEKKLDSKFILALNTTIILNPHMIKADNKITIPDQTLAKWLK